MAIRGNLSKVLSSPTLRYLKRNKRFLASISIVAAIVVLAIIGPYLTPYQPDQVAGPIMNPPSFRHPFGTDYFGYDVFSESVYGLRISLEAGVIGALIATLIGVLFGMLAGYRGGLSDAIIEFLTNTLLAIPSLLILILVITYAGRRGVVELGLLVGILAWPWTSRAVRSQVAALKVLDYIKTSRLSGNSGLHILFKDILPNIASYVFVVFVAQLSGAMLAIVTLEFFGLGASQWSLGGILNLAVIWGAVTLNIWWWWAFPAIILVALIASLFLITASLGEAFNPALRGEG